MRFIPHYPPRLWTGRYARIPGKQTAFHVSSEGVLTAEWTDHEEDEILTGRILDTPETQALGKALNETKSSHAGSPGGSFLINEYGEIICPIAGGSQRYYVGQLRGEITVQNPVSGGTLTLAPPRETTPGTRWRGPYVGMPFNLSGDDRIYFKHESDDMIQKIWLDRPNAALVSSLRQVRPAGGLRFIVNPHGAVFTKAPDSLGNWSPVFISYIDPSNWYPREA